MGAQFAAAVSEYLVSCGEEARGIGVIKSNPKQSKHLETATMRVSQRCAALVDAPTAATPMKLWRQVYSPIRTAAASARHCSRSRRNKHEPELRIGRLSCNIHPHVMFS